MAIEAAEGLRIGVQFAYDLELPADFQPRNDDGEVSEFQLWSLPQLEESLRGADDFMFDAAWPSSTCWCASASSGRRTRTISTSSRSLRGPAPFVRT